MLVDLTKEIRNYDGSPIARSEKDSSNMTVKDGLLAALNYKERNAQGQPKKQSVEKTIEIFRLSEKMMSATLIELTPEQIAEARKNAVEIFPNVVAGALCVALETSAEAEKKEEVKQDEPVAKSE